MQNFELDAVLTDETVFTTCTGPGGAINGIHGGCTSARELLYELSKYNNIIGKYTIAHTPGKQNREGAEEVIRKIEALGKRELYAWVGVYDDQKVHTYDETTKRFANICDNRNINRIFSDVASCMGVNIRLVESKNIRNVCNLIDMQEAITFLDSVMD